MKIRRPIFPALLLMWVLAVAPGPRAACLAQDDQEENTSSSTTYDSTGTVTAISPPLTITVNSRRGPFTYQLGPDLFVFGANRKAAKIDQVHRGDAVTVYYYKRLGQETAARIVVLKAADARRH